MLLENLYDLYNLIILRLSCVIGENKSTNIKNAINFFPRLKLIYRYDS